MVHPFVKWVGGKRQILKEITACFPTEFGNTLTKYAEPFVGGGAVLFYVLSNYNLQNVYINDINSKLINCYNVIKFYPHELIEILQQLENNYLAYSVEERKKNFYLERLLFNTKKFLIPYDIEQAARFIFLNKTCFNGLYRVNKKGEFNVPAGAYKNPKICDAENLQQVHLKLQNVEICCGDYQKANSFIDNKTLVYFDPPYLPISPTSNFTSYNENNFSIKDQIKLAHYVRKMANKGAKIILSNSNPQNSNSCEDFVNTFYKNFKIQEIQAKRVINSNYKKRGYISEVIISS